MQNKIRVLVAEDEAVIRESIVKRIGLCDSDFTVCAEAENGAQAWELIEQDEPDVLFTDVRMPVMDGLELLRSVQLGHPKVKLVILSGYSDFSYLQEAIRRGVSSYLLKPLEEDALQDTLQELKLRLLREQYFREAAVRHSPDYTLNGRENLQQLLFAVCLGNLCYDAGDPELQNFYKNLPPVPWDQVLEEILPNQVDWLVGDAELNERIISIRTERLTEDPAECAVRIQSRLRKLFPRLPVHLAYTETTADLKEVFLRSRRLCNLLHSRVRPGVSCLLNLEKDEKIELSQTLDIVKMRVQDELRTQLEAGDARKVEEELTLIFSFLLSHGVSQRDVEKVITHIVRFYEFCGGEAQAGSVRAQALRFLSVADSAEGLAEALAQKLTLLFWPESVPAELNEQLCAYVDAHFMQLEQLDKLTEVFHYNYTYLSRVFKKCKGVALNTYIREKRLALARELILTNNNLSSGQIAAFCGYSDRRSFLRAFKGATGLSPGDFRRKMQNSADSEISE